MGFAQPSFFSSLMLHRKLGFRQKLLLGIALSLFTVVGAGGVLADTWLKERLLEQARQQMATTSQGIQITVRSIVANSIKNYLKGIADTNLAYVEQLHARQLSGALTEVQAKQMAEEFMLRQRIGASGFVSVVDIGGNVPRYAVHPKNKGGEMRNQALAEKMAQQKSGYLELEWTSARDASRRLKAQWMSWFEPWKWIIVASPFRGEYQQLVDLAGVEAELAGVDMPGRGYAFIMNSKGELLSHPTLKGGNLLDAVDARSGEPYIRRIIDGIREARAAERSDGLTGVIRYRDAQGVVTTGEQQGRDHLLNYRYLPEVDWIVGIVANVDELEAPLKPIRATLAAVLVLSLLLAMLVVVRAVRPITRSIDTLAAAVEHVDRGNLAAPMPPLADDEIGRLARAFGRMAGRLARYTDELEQRVAERTSALQASNTSLEATLNELRATQTQLIQSEKMASLGQLVANVAHEINTPIGAVKSSGKNIADALAATLDRLPRLYEVLDGSERTLFRQLIEAGTAAHASLTTREERALIREATASLDALGIPGARHIAGVLVQWRVHGRLEEWLPLLRHPENEFILGTAAELAALVNNTHNINTAVDRVSRIVFALKSFARADTSGTLIEASLLDGIETVLTIYQNQIRQHVELIRQYEDTPLIACLPDELNQVWTNLIHNALQAMDYKGTLTIAVRRDGAEAVVSIGDTGGGIPDDLRERIFEPFFTTRPQGEGSGLGLDIVKKIVDKHKGRIAVQSTVGIGSTFSVHLPYLAHETP